MTNFIDHSERYRLDKLASLVDTFECLIDDKVAGKMKFYEDYPNILLQSAGKASLTLRAILNLCASGFPDAALILARQIYEQSIVLCFFEQIKQQSDFENRVKDYYADYNLQIAQYNKWQAENLDEDSNDISKYQNQIDAIHQNAYSKKKGAYWWSGFSTFKDIVDFLFESVDSRLVIHMKIMHLLYMRACKDVHVSALGNALRLGSDSEIGDVDNSAKTTGYGLPLYFAVNSFNLIAYIVFSNMSINGEKLIHDLDELLDLYARIDLEENSKSDK